jgi:hypothetical protein
VQTFPEDGIRFFFAHADFPGILYKFAVYVDEKAEDNNEEDEKTAINKKFMGRNTGAPLNLISYSFSILPDRGDY